MLIQPYTLQIQSTPSFNEFLNYLKQMIQLFLKNSI